MMLAAVGVSSRALWYMTRGFGLVALVLLTVSTVLGLAQVARYTRPGLPRFVVSALHKNAALLAVVAIAVHVVTAVLDTFAPIHLIDVFVPLASRYRPLWTGLGALALDMLLAVIATSLVRERIGHRTWRAVHWIAYACWPVALVHAIGTGSDAKVGWVLFVYVVCAAAVVAALWWRLAVGWTASNSAVRGTAVVASLVIPIVIAAWTAGGPLRSGWARKAGTPSSLLASAAGSSGSSSSAGSSPSASGGAAPSNGSSATLPVPYSASFTGTQSETGPDANGLVSVVISGNLEGSTTGSLRLVLTGQPAEDGGVSLTGSEVDIGPPSAPKELTGHVTELEGTTVVASLSDARGDTVIATISLELSRSETVRGEVQLR